MSKRFEYGEAMHGIEVQNSALDRPPSGSATDQTITSPDNIDKLRDFALTQHRTMQQQVPALQRYLVSGVERCLAQKGYRPFALTRDQQHALAKLAHGSQARFEYLHHLAADPAILAAQAPTAPVGSR